jgi:hypothetical protein
MKKQLDLAKKNPQPEAEREMPVALKRVESASLKNEDRPQEVSRLAEMAKMPVPTKPAQTGSRSVTFILIGIIVLMILFIYYLFFMST